MESRLNFLFAFLAVILIATVAMHTYSGTSPSIPAYFPRKVRLTESLARADQAGRPAFIVFVARPSEPCESFLQGSLSSHRVARLMATTVYPFLFDAARADCASVEAAAVMDRFGDREYPPIPAVRKGHVTAWLAGEASAEDLEARLTGLESPPSTPAG